VTQLKADGIHVLDVGQGDQACGETGDGRMLEAEEILEDLEAFFAPKTMTGKAVLVTAGPTYEAIDPVRGITNRSSGKMGFAIARAAADAGAMVTLVAGPVALLTPHGVQRIDVLSAEQMHAAVLAQAEQSDVFVAAAAVADWRVDQAAGQKIKKEAGAAPPALRFLENPDILTTVAASARARSGRLFCVGFAAESENLLAHAQAKRARKNVPLLVGNIGPDTFGQDDNALLLVVEHGHRDFPRASKDDLARAAAAIFGAELAGELLECSPAYPLEQHLSDDPGHPYFRGVILPQYRSGPGGRPGGPGSTSSTARTSDTRNTGSPAEGEGDVAGTSGYH
jgi:phosphopantothenoylcysteine decarboxylase/phosphopantothenate--cysteine ligase